MLPSDPKFAQCMRTEDREAFLKASRRFRRAVRSELRLMRQSHYCPVQKFRELYVCIERFAEDVHRTHTCPNLEDFTDLATSILEGEGIEVGPDQEAAIRYLYKEEDRIRSNRVVVRLVALGKVMEIDPRVVERDRKNRALEQLEMAKGFSFEHTSTFPLA